MLIPVPRSGAAVQARAITGIVFLDKNVNGVRDTGEPGLAQVAVSDQAHVVLTGPTGAFELPTGGGYGMVFVSVPDGFRPVGPFWRRVEEDAPIFPLLGHRPRASSGSSTRPTPTSTLSASRAHAAWRGWWILSVLPSCSSPVT
jgi:hypothetical protein